MTEADWLYALGETTLKRQGILKLLPYIKMTDDNKYWIDMVAYEKYLDYMRQRGNRIGFTVIGFIVILMLVSLFLSLQ